MNTKNFFLAIIILASPYLATAGINQKNHFHVQQELGGGNSKSTPVDTAIHWEMVWPYDEFHHNRGEKIGKVHCFYFDRFCGSRRKIAILLAIKILLVIVHASSFFISMIKMLH